MEPQVLSAPAAHIRIADLVQNADPVVQGVIVILALASIICWATILEKAIRLWEFGVQVGRLEHAAGAAKGEIPANSWLASAVIQAAQGQKFSDLDERSEIEAGLEKAMRRAARIELNRLQPRVRFLATVGSTAPFIGLFGTVWGIMNSFSAIAQQKDTSLAVVAPGIAEALFATALGLVAAIPAVIAYNQISGSLARAAERMNLAVAAIANTRAQHAAMAINEG